MAQEQLLEFGKYQFCIFENMIIEFATLLGPPRAHQQLPAERRRGGRAGEIRPRAVRPSALQPSFGASPPLGMRTSDHFLNSLQLRFKMMHIWYA